MVQKMIEMLERAFDEVVMTDEDWVELKESMFGAQPGQPGAEGGGDDAVLMEMMRTIDNLPPEAKRGLGEAMARGVPIDQAIQEVLQMVGQQPNPQGEQNV